MWILGLKGLKTSSLFQFFCKKVIIMVMIVTAMTKIISNKTAELPRLLMFSVNRPCRGFRRHLDE